LVLDILVVALPEVERVKLMLFAAWNAVASAFQVLLMREEMYHTFRRLLKQLANVHFSQPQNRTINNCQLVDSQ
jgi:hypothetical protein